MHDQNILLVMNSNLGLATKVKIPNTKVLGISILKKLSLFHSKIKASDENSITIPFSSIAFYAAHNVK
jgi:hypothetical protein